MASYNGVQAPIGAAAPRPGKGASFMYREDRFFGLLGRVTYQVIVVDKEFNYDDSAKEASVLNTSSTPEFALV